MSLTELETAIDQLTAPQQEELLRHLEDTLRRKRNGSGPQPRDQWMRRLRSLRASIDTGTTVLSGEQILAELRED